MPPRTTTKSTDEVETAPVSPSPAASTRTEPDPDVVEAVQAEAKKGEVALVVHPQQFPTKRVELDGVTYSRSVPVLGDKKLLDLNDPQGRPYLAEA